MADPLSAYADDEDLSAPLQQSSLTAPPPLARVVSKYADTPDPDPLPHALARAQQTPPDTAARVLALQRKTGLPSDLIGRNLDAIEGQAKAANFDAAAFRKSSPLLASWLEANPAHAAVAADDLDLYGHVERTVRHVVDIRRGVESTIGNAFATAEAIGEATGSEWMQEFGGSGRRASTAALAALPVPKQFTAIDWRHPTEVATWLHDLVGDQIPVMGPQIAGAAAGGLAGSALGPVGTVIGAALGGFLPAFVGGVGETQTALKAAGGEDATAPLAVLAGGSAIAVLDTAMPGHVGGRLAGAFGKETAEQIARRVLMTPVKAHWLKAAGKELATEGIAEAVQEAIGAHTVARGLGIPVEPGLGMRMLDAGAAGAALGVGVSLATSPIEARAERTRAAAATAIYQANVLNTIGPALAGAKSLTLAPEAVEAFVASTTKDGALERVYMPVTAWTEYWQKKGADPAEVAAIITGDRAIYETALKSGEDMVIPFARYAVGIAATEHNAAFAQEVRVLGPGSMNVREAIAYQTALLTPAAPAPATTEAAEDRVAFVQLQVAKGMPVRDAEVVADWQAALLGGFEHNAEIVQAGPFYRQYGVELNVHGVAPTTPLESRAPAAAAPIDPAALAAIAEVPAEDPAPAAAPAAGAAPPVATFAHYLPSVDGAPPIAQYTVQGSEADQSTVSAGTLEARGIAIPATPPAVDVQAGQRAAQLARQQDHDAMFGRPVDAPAPEAQTERTDDTGTADPRVEDVPRRRPAVDRVYASTRESRRESDTARDARRTKHYAAVFLQIKNAAKQLDPAVDVKALRAAFLERVRYAEEADAEWRVSGENPRVLLEAIAAAGGIGMAIEEGSGYAGELRRLREGMAFGNLAGVRGVFQAREVGRAAHTRAGISLDEMRMRLTQDPAFAYLETVDDLLRALDDAVRNGTEGKGRIDYPGTEELRKIAGVDPAKDWWKPGPEQQFYQGLFDEDPIVDVLDTGEQQPRLPGAEDVRDAEIATPAFEAPFALTSPTSKARGRQDTLFQSAFHGSPHIFDKFELHAIGTGEGAQAYGWGLYFASAREVAEGYRRDLTQDAVPVFSALTAEENNALPDWVRRGIATPALENAFQYYRDEFAKRAAEEVAILADDPIQPHMAQMRLDRHRATTAALAKLEAAGDQGYTVAKEGRLYKVDIPEDGDYLDWDKPANAQSAKVKAALEDFRVATWFGYTLAEFLAKPAAAREGLAETIPPAFGAEPGAAAYAFLTQEFGGARQASEYLASKGIAGIRYLDGFSRSTGEGSSNYVVFDDALVSIEEFFQPVAAFYSRLTRAVEDSKQEKANGAQWKAQIKNAKIGINQDEFAYVSIDDLADRRSYSKQEVLDYISAHAVVVEDVTLEGEAGPSSEEIHERSAELRQERIDADLENFEYDGDDGADYPTVEARMQERDAEDEDEADEVWEAFVNGQDVGEYYSTEEEALEAGQAEADRIADKNRDADEEHAREQERDYLEEKYSIDEFNDQAQRELGGDGASRGVQYGEYVEKGEARDYKEVFLTVPNVHGSESAAARAARAEIAAIRASTGDGRREATPEQSARLRELRAGPVAEDDAPAWVDGHEPYDDIVNPIVRIRMNTRETAAGPTLFLEEVQTPHPDQFAKMPALFQKNWRAIAFKWALRHAAEQNLAAVAWTTGEMQAARYSLEKEVDAVTWRKMAAGNNESAGAEVRGVTLTTKTRGQISFDVDAAGVVMKAGASMGAEAWAGAPLENVIGKEFAEKILGADVGDLRGEGLKIGGEGLKRLYNVDFRNVVQALPAVKKLGGKVGRVEIEIGRAARYVYTGREFTAAELRAKAANMLEEGGPRFFPVQREQMGRIAERLEGGGITYSNAFANYGTPALAEYLGTKFESVETAELASVPALILTPELGTAVLGGQALFQPRAPQDANRGSIRFGRDPVTGKINKTVISLFKLKNKSTLLHELSHLYFMMYGDLVEALGAYDPATLSANQQRFLADYQVILAELGVEPGGTIETVHHEKWARSWEAYLRTGKAPSVPLLRAFAAFRNWLVKIYPSLQALDVELSPEMVAIFDRMLASDAAIAEVEAHNVLPMFTDARSAGMSDAVFADYRGKIQEASDAARAAVDAKLLADAQKTETAEWRRKRAIIEDAVTFEIQRRPVYQALAAFQRGTYPNGIPILTENDAAPPKLSRAAIVAEFGVERLRTLPRPTVVTAGPDGLAPQEAADLFGFSSGDALLTALATAPEMKRAIQQEIDARLADVVGEALTDSSLLAAAQAATATEAREAIVRAELRALAELKRRTGPMVRTAVREAGREQAYERRWLEAEAKLRIAIAEGHKQVEIDALQEEVDNLARKAAGGPAAIKAALPPIGLVREAAAARVSGTRLRDLQPHLFWAAAARANKAAITAAATQDFDAAIAAQQQYLLNLTLFREATRALEDAERRVAAAKKLGTPAARSRLGLADTSYLDQVDAILERYDFATVSRPALDQRESLREWLAALEAEGQPIDHIPALVLKEAHRINYRELTVAELVEVSDGLTMIVHLAQQKNAMLKSAAALTLHGLASSVAASIRGNTEKTRPGGPTMRLPAAQKKWELDGLLAGHRKMASLAYAMDGYQDGGAVVSALMTPLNEAGSQEAGMHADATRRTFAIMQQAYPGRQKDQLWVRREFPAIKQSLVKMQVVMIALNWGAEGNRQRIMTGYGWSAEQVATVLDSLDQRDWVMVQALAAFVDAYWPQIVAKQQRVTGVAPEKVLGSPFMTKFGEMPGWYFPLAYDGEQSPQAATHGGLEAAQFQKQAAYVHATTRRGYLEKRKEHVKLPVLLDFKVLTNHVRGVIHDLSHHEALIDVGRVLSHPLVSGAIYQTWGPQVYEQFTAGIHDVAQGEAPAANAFERSLNHFRVGTTIALLAWNLGTSLMQPLGLTNSVARIGGVWVARGAKRWIGDALHAENTVRFVTDRSPFMQTRFLTQQREINEIRNTFGIATGRLSGWVDEAIARTTFDLVSRQAIAESYFWMIAAAQRAADMPTWLGQYEKALTLGEPEERAIQQADQAVLDAQGGGQTKDLAAVQRGGPMLKLWTNFYSFMNVVYNLAAEAHGKRNVRAHPSQIGRLAVDYLWIYTTPAVLGYLIRAGMGGGGPDEDESWLEELAKEQISYMMGTMLGLREFSGAVKGFQNYAGPAGARPFASGNRIVTEIMSKAGAVYRSEEPLEELTTIDPQLGRATVDLAGAAFHFPSGQVMRTLAGVVAIIEGKTVNPGALVVGAPKEARD